MTKSSSTIVGIVLLVLAGTALLQFRGMSSSGVDPKPETGSRTIKTPDLQSLTWEVERISGDKSTAVNHPLPHDAVVVISATSSSGHPVEGATVIVAHESGLQAPTSFSTNKEGFTDIPLEKAKWSTISINKEGFATRTLRLSNTPKDLYQVILVKGVSISGRLEMADQGNIPNNVRVFVWEEGTEIGSGTLSTAYTDCGGRYSVEVETDGSFLATGLHPEKKYGVTAYGGGVVVHTNNEARQQSPLTEAVYLIGHYLYGAKVSVKDDDHLSEILASMALPWQAPSHFNHESLTFPISKPDAVLHHDTWSIVLAGLAPAGPRRALLPVHVFASMNTLASTPVTAEFSIGIAGLNASTGQFNLERADGPANLKAAHLLAEGPLEEPGSVAIHIGYKGQEFDFRAVRRIPAQIQLQGTPLGQSGYYEYNARWSSENGCYRADGVMPGQYLARLHLRETGLVLPTNDNPMIPVTVVSGEETNLEIKAPDLGVLEVIIEPNGPEQYTGAVNVRVMKPDNNSTELVFYSLNPAEHSFDRPPYRMGPFLAGDYYIQVIPMGMPGGTGFPQPMTIEKGENAYAVKLAQ